ncbi:MAG: lysoplasmalogenase [Deltaproteobacteria bacterium]|uniref:Lysoplasmalogenase n=1 Tax=Candidatus Zymogenus saltonus TaxID=2844893 RepID=A0A9D8KEM7_9DELT|nr:lysoplasmalogenase [Candidatus Zymogenus saltonus]
MSCHLLAVPFSLAGILLYFIARKRNDLKRVEYIQPLTTLLIIAVAALGFASENANDLYTIFILVGLTFSLIGDCWNVDMTDMETVIYGLIVFVFAYFTYPLAFTVMDGFHREDIIVGLICLALYAGLISYCWRGLKGMKVPGMIYGLVLFILISRAISTFFGDTFSTAQSILITAGTGMIFLGDVQFAIETFRKPPPPKLVIDLKVIGPILYAGGQLLIALSTSYFPGP